MSLKEQLLTFAKEKAFPYLKELPNIKDYADDICFLIVGSVATETCDDFSDLDICMLCRQDTLDKISVETNWSKGRPTEVILDETQLHFYGVSIHSVKEKIKQFDDTYLYVYRNAVVLQDKAELYPSVISLIDNDEAKRERLRKRTDTFIRRRKALTSVMEQSVDPIVRLEIALENIQNLLVIVALTDDVQFDRRKRLYRTALRGTLGKQLRPKVDELLQLMGRVGIAENSQDVQNFLAIVDECFARCSN